MKKSKKKLLIILSTIIALVLILGGILFIKVKPMLISGHITETSGKIIDVSGEAITLKTDDGSEIECRINSKTYFVNDYKPTTGDYVTSISDYTGDNDKTVKCKRMYKNRE